MTDVNSSINNLIGTFATVDIGNFQPIPDKLVCIDTSNNRIGINTIDPSYGIHVKGDHNDGTIGSTGLIISPPNPINTIKVIFKNLPELTDLASLETGQLYNDGGTLKIK